MSVTTQADPRPNRVRKLLAVVAPTGRHRAPKDRTSAQPTTSTTEAE